MSDPDREIAEYIEQSIRSLEAEGAERKFDERMLHAPVGVLEPRAPLIVEPLTSVLEAVTLMQEHRVGCVLVVRTAKLKGIFTERDVLTSVVGKAIDPAKTPVRKLMTPNPEYLRLTDSIAYALNKMSLGGYRHVPIVDADVEPSLSMTELRRGKPVLPKPAHGPLDAIPLIGFHLVDAIRAGTVTVRGGVVSLTETGAQFMDGVEEPFDDVILATGFTAALAPLGNLVRPDAKGFAVRAARVTSADQPHLYFVGHSYDSTGGLYNIKRDSALAAERIAAGARRGAA